MAKQNLINEQKKSASSLWLEHWMGMGEERQEMHEPYFFFHQEIGP